MFSGADSENLPGEILPTSFTRTKAYQADTRHISR
jgi:hypothetical protein